MATPIWAKRMVRERESLEKPNEDYFVFFPDDNLQMFYAYIIGPTDSLYASKFVKLKFEIPDRYPLVPPKCTFIQHTGGRIHPNLYVEGKVCLSILGTWPGEPWALAMTIHTVLLTIRSLLDYEPYKHEPNQRDNPGFNDYVQYGTWTWLFLDYLKRESDPAAKRFLEEHISRNSASILNNLRRQSEKYRDVKTFWTVYGGANRSLIVNYSKLLTDVEACVKKCCDVMGKSEKEVEPDINVADERRLTAEPKQAKSQSQVIIDIDQVEVEAKATHHEARNRVPAAVTTSKNKTSVNVDEIEVIDLT